MKKRILLTLTLFTLLMMVLAGCGKKKTEVQNPPENAIGESILSVMDLLGKSDEEAKNFYNGGTENRTEDGTILLGRSYITTLDNNAATLETVYSDNETVVSVAVSFTNKTPQEVKTIVTGIFGQPEVTNESQEMESEYLTWTKDKISIIMNENYGMPIVEFALINE